MEGQVCVNRDYTEFFDFHDASPELRSRVRADFILDLRDDLRTAGVQPARIEPVVQRLWGQMSGPIRRYHSAVHLLGMFDYARRVGLELPMADRLAIWFHDSVFDPSAAASHNEGESAKLLLDVIASSGIDPSPGARAAESIRWTAHHTADDVPAEHHRVLDLDLAGFAAEPPIFARQSAALRIEYAHVPDSTYNRATVTFLGKLLARDSIYRTLDFAALEPVARAQIHREIDRLSAL